MCRVRSRYSAFSVAAHEEHRTPRARSKREAQITHQRLMKPQRLTPFFEEIACSLSRFSLGFSKSSCAQSRRRQSAQYRESSERAFLVQD